MQKISDNMNEDTVAIVYILGVILHNLSQQYCDELDVQVWLICSSILVNNIFTAVCLFNLIDTAIINKIQGFELFV